MAYLVFLLLLSWPAIAAAAQPLQNLSPLTAEEQRGQQLFEKGTSARGSKIEASLPGGVRVPASAVPCAGCHGIDGLGRPEGGIVPANVTWDALTKPYGHVRPDGRTRVPYTDRTLRRAVTMGFDASGNELSSVMPRFQLTMRDAADLIAYLKKLGETVDPGLTASTVRLGVLLPREQTVKNKQLVRQAMLHYFASVNGAGGVFGRAIETSFTELPSDTARQSAAILDFLHDQHVFAVLGDFTGAEPEIAAVMLKTATPAIAAIAPSPQTDSPLNRYVFYLDGGVTEQRNASDLKSADQRNWERATAAAEIITEAMTRAGRALTRGGLVQALEGFSNVQTSLPAPVSFGPNRRVGISGVQASALDPSNPAMGGRL